MAAYTGASLGYLSEVASGPGSFTPVYFSAQAGTTYYLQVAKMALPFFGSPVVTITIERPGPPSPRFSFFPVDPSVQ